MTGVTPSHPQSVRDLLRIGQVWQHHGSEQSIQIRQIHRADRVVEAWFDTPDGLRSHAVAFADLQHDYELVES
jgi:hypothetical protein